MNGVESQKNNLDQIVYWLCPGRLCPLTTALPLRQPWLFPLKLGPADQHWDDCWARAHDRRSSW